MLNSAYNEKFIKRLRRKINPVTLSLYGAILFISLSTLIVLMALWKMLSARETGSPLLSIIETASNKEYIRTISRTMKYATLAIILKILIALPLALVLLRARFKKMGSIFLLPWVLPPAISALAWMWLFYDINGGANILLKLLGFSEISWLGDGQFAFIICLIFNVWREVPLWAWIISPTLSGLRGSVALLAEQDNLTDWEKFRLLTVPKLRPVLIALSILSLIWTFGEFETIWILTKGGPGEATELLSVYAYRHTFMAQNIAHGAAAFLCFFPISITIITILIMIYQWSNKRAMK
jgi:multiple sugar transport system permease protein